MRKDEFFVWLLKYCRDAGYSGLTPSSVIHEAQDKGLDIGSILVIGRNHLIPRGWKRVVSTRGQVIYLVPEEGE